MIAVFYNFLYFSGGGGPVKQSGGGNSGNDGDAENEKLRGALSQAIVTEKPDVKWWGSKSLEMLMISRPALSIYSIIEY